MERRACRQARGGSADSKGPRIKQESMEMDCSMCQRNFATERGLKMHQRRPCKPDNQQEDSGVPASLKVDHQASSESDNEPLVKTAIGKRLTVAPTENARKVEDNCVKKGVTVGADNEDNSAKSSFLKINAIKINDFGAQLKKRLQSIQSLKAENNTVKDNLTRESAVDKNSTNEGIIKDDSTKDTSIENNDFGAQLKKRLQSMLTGPKAMALLRCQQCGQALSIGHNNSLCEHCAQDSSDEESEEDKDDAEEQVEVVTWRKKYKCHYCGKIIQGSSMFKIHTRSHTGERPYACDFCSKSFSSLTGLNKHRRIHTGEKPYCCSQCDMRFSLKGTLNRHMRVHTGVRPHKCPYCGKEFIQGGGLKAHLFLHTGANGFSCSQCDKVFSRKTQLELHVKNLHLKLKPHLCGACGKGFTRREDLARHAVLHTGEKPHQCPTCPKRFAIKNALKNHMVTHNREKPRLCNQCGRAFVRKDRLMLHMRKHHRDLFELLLLEEEEESLARTTAVKTETIIPN